MGGAEAVICAHLDPNFFVAYVIDGYLREPGWFPSIHHLGQAGLFLFHGGGVVVLVEGRPGILFLLEMNAGFAEVSAMLMIQVTVTVACLIIFFWRILSAGDNLSHLKVEPLVIVVVLVDAIWSVLLSALLQ